MGGSFDVFSRAGEYLGTLVTPSGSSALGCLVFPAVLAVAGMCLYTALFPPFTPFTLILLGVMGLLGGLVWQFTPGQGGKAGPLVLVIVSGVTVLAGLTMIGVFLVFAIVVPMVNP